MPIHRAHRMGRYQRNKTRPIVAKFAFYPKREEIRKAAKNLEGTQYPIGQQFPKEIQERRRQLAPILKDAKSKGQKAHIAVDKLYIEGKLYKQSDSTNTASAAKLSHLISSQSRQGLIILKHPIAFHSRTRKKHRTDVRVKSVY